MKTIHDDNEGFKSALLRAEIMPDGIYINVHLKDEESEVPITIQGVFKDDPSPRIEVIAAKIGNIATKGFEE